MVLFFFNDPATTEIYTLSLHDALPISAVVEVHDDRSGRPAERPLARRDPPQHRVAPRSEEHTSELQSRQYLVCRLLLEKNKPRQNSRPDHRSAHRPVQDHGHKSAEDLS